MKWFWSLRESNSNSSHYRTIEYGLDVVQQGLFQFVLSSKLAIIQRFANVSGNQEKKTEKMYLKDDLDECEKGDEFERNEAKEYQSKFSSSIF